MDLFLSRRPPWRPPLLVAAGLLLTLLACTPGGEQTTADGQGLRPPIQSATAGETIPVSVAVDGRVISEVRLYFKPLEAASYVYMTMTPGEEDSFAAAIPPCKNGSRGLDYLLLFRDDDGKSRKTKPFRLLLLNNPRGVKPSAEAVEVYGEETVEPAVAMAFAAPLRILPSPRPLLREAEEEDYPSILPTSTRTSPFAPWRGPGGFSFSIKVGGVGFFYRAH
jgi:hypothetical protein